MRVRNRSGERVAFAAVVLVFALGGTQAKSDVLGCRMLPGTYVTTITDIEGVFASRGIVTFFPSGILITTDSRQGGQTGVYDPFSAGQGAWSCSEGGGGSVRFSGLSLTFTMPPGSSGSKFGRVDYTGTIDPNTAQISGELSLRLSEAQDLEGADPLGNQGEVLETFNFVGSRVVAP